MIYKQKVIRNPINKTKHLHMAYYIHFRNLALKGPYIDTLKFGKIILFPCDSSWKSMYWKIRGFRLRNLINIFKEVIDLYLWWPHN